MAIVEQFERFRALRHALDTVGGWLGSEPTQRAVISLSAKSIPNEVLQAIAEFRNVRQLSLSVSGIADSQFEYFSHLKGLQILDLGSTTITGTGLAWIPRTLKRLRLHGCSHLTKEGLSNLRSFQKLVHLDLTGTPVMDDAMVFVGTLSRLQVLCLEETAIPDEGLRALFGLTRLHTILLRGNPNLTDDGIDELYRRVPTLKDWFWC